MPQFTPPPQVPQRGDRSTFSQRVDSFLRWLVTFVAQLNLFTSNLNARDAGGAATFAYTFDTSTQSNDPGPGKIRFDNANQALALSIYIDNLTDAGMDIGAYLNTIQNVSSNVKGSVRIERAKSPGNWVLFDITSVADSGGYKSLSVVARASSASSPFSGNDVVILYFDRNGDKGDGGNTPTSEQIRNAVGILPITNGGTAANTAAVGLANLGGISKQSLSSAEGAALVGYGDQNLAEVLKKRAQVVVDSVAALRVLDKSRYTRAFVSGYYSAGDGGGGSYSLLSNDSSSVDNGGSLLVSSDGGRWKLDGQVTSYKQFGAGCVAGADDTTALTKMINAIGGIVGGRGSLAISAPLPFVEGLFIRLDDSAGSNTGGALTVHSSVANPSTFDYFSAAGTNIEHVEFSGVRFYKGRHVIRCDNAAGGFLSQVNLENCVFQELDGYVISATNSVFVIDFHKCRFIRCGGVNLGYGVNILKFRDCGFEIMRREYIKIDGQGSNLPSASVHLTGCRCEAVEDRNASMCFDIKGYGRLFNFVIDGATYFENVYSRIGTFDGVRALNLSDINFTNSTVYNYTITANDCEVYLRSIESLVTTVFNPTGNTVVNDAGGHTPGFIVISAGTANIIGAKVSKQKMVPAGVTNLINFVVVPTGSNGATVFSTYSGDLVLSIAGSKVNDGTAIYVRKRYAVIVRKMFGGNLGATFTEYANNGAISDLTIALAVVTSASDGLTLGVGITAPTGDLGAGLALAYSIEGTALTANENPITARLL